MHQRQVDLAITQHQPFSESAASYGRGHQGDAAAKDLARAENDRRQAVLLDGIYYEVLGFQLGAGVGAAVLRARLEAGVFAYRRVTRSGPVYYRHGANMN